MGFHLGPIIRYVFLLEMLLLLLFVCLFGWLVGWVVGWVVGWLVVVVVVGSFAGGFVLLLWLYFCWRCYCCRNSFVEGVVCFVLLL